MPPSFDASDGTVPQLSDSAAAFQDAQLRLAQGTGAFAIDTERAGSYIANDRLCLLQIRRAGCGTVLLDAFRQGLLIADFAPVLQDAPWILHDAATDLPALLSAGLQPGSIRDTVIAARLLGVRRFGLRALLEQFLGISIAKGLAQVDWSLRPLSASQLEYAALDVEHLHALHEELFGQLVVAGREQWYLEECQRVVEHARPLRPLRWFEVKGIDRVPAAALPLLRAVFEEVQRLAVGHDVASHLILSNRMLVDICAGQRPYRALTVALQNGKHAARFVPRDSILDVAREALAVPYPQRLALAQAELNPQVVASRRHPLQEFLAGMPPASKWKDHYPELFGLSQAIHARIGSLAADLGIDPSLLLTAKDIRRLTFKLSEHGIQRFPMASGQATITDDVLQELRVLPWRRRLIVEALQ